MKKFNLKSIAVAMLICCVSFANAQKIWVPDGTQLVKESENSTKLIFKNNESIYLGTSSEGSAVRTQIVEAWVSCDCTGTGTCMPGSAFGKVGCGGDCSACTMKSGGISMRTMDGTLIKIESGGFINLNFGVRLCSESDISNKVPAAFNEMFDNEEVINGIKAFINEQSNGLKIPEIINNNNGSISAPDGFVLQPIVAFGRGLLILLPKEKGNATAIGSDGKASCSCTAGTCTLKSKLMATYCDGDCSGTCTLNTGKNIANSELIPIFESSQY
ncbi:MAG: hypothetical protein WCI53_09590 [Bacteroidota bacterium]|jgi:hypothetical protein